VWLPRVVWGAGDVESLAGCCCTIPVKEAYGGRADISKRVVLGMMLSCPWIVLSWSLLGKGPGGGICDGL